MRDPQEPVVLVVEADPSLAAKYERWLSDSYGISIVTDGRAALDALDDTFDVVLLDSELPGEDEAELLHEIRRRDVDVQVVAMATADPGVDAVEVGFDAVVTKPVDADVLKQTVEDLLDRAEAGAELTEYHSLMERKGQLEADLTSEELADDEEYEEICEELDGLERDVDEKMGELDSEMEFVGTVREVAGPSETFETGADGSAGETDRSQDPAPDETRGDENDDGSSDSGAE